MKLRSYFLIWTFFPLIAYAQSGDFPFGKVTYAELEMKKYEPDTSAEAVVLNEFGKTSFNDDVDIVFEYHVRIKILKKEGLEKADFVIPLYKDGSDVDKEEKWVSLEASIFNKESNRIAETKFDQKNFIIEKTNQYKNLAKFALPNVKVGSVIEVKYMTVSPYFFEFHPWEFQDNIPKVRSEYWSSIPANFAYSITLKGFLKFSKSTVEEVKDCFRMPESVPHSDCSRGKYVMENIPAFKEENYMTAKKNYISSINYELSKMIHANGSATNFSEGWKDVDQKLKEYDFFGGEIKKARRMMEDVVTPLVANESNNLKKAQLVYDFIKKKYKWNGKNAKYSREDVNKVFGSGEGSSADINFALVGALQSINLNADPVLVSTRDNGIPFKEHPQQSDFNYVISSLRIDDKLYLLDATEDFLPFGVLPMRCLNDQGRLVSKEESSWVDLKSNQKQRTTIAMDLKLDESGLLKGNMTIQFFGYDALEQRKEFVAAESQENYFKERAKVWQGMEVSNSSIENQNDLSKPFIEKMDIEFVNNNGSGDIFYFNPYMVDRWDTNPFKSNERLFPVDYGAPLEISYFITMELPESVKVDEAPANASFALPNSGGKCLVSVTTLGKKVILSSIISLSKPIYSSDEYHYLREFYSRIIQLQQSQFVFKKVK